MKPQTREGAALELPKTLPKPLRDLKKTTKPASGSKSPEEELFITEDLGRTRFTSRRESEPDRPKTTAKWTAFTKNNPL